MVVEEGVSTLLRALLLFMLSVVVFIFFLPMVINGGAESCCCGREDGECVAVAPLYFWISQLAKNSPHIWSRWP